MEFESRRAFETKGQFIENVLKPSKNVLENDKSTIRSMADASPNAQNMVIAYYLAQVLRELQKHRSGRPRKNEEVES